MVMARPVSNYHIGMVSKRLLFFLHAINTKRFVFVPAYNKADDEVVSEEHRRRGTSVAQSFSNKESRLRRPRLFDREILPTATGSEEVQIRYTRR